MTIPDTHRSIPEATWARFAVIVGLAACLSYFESCVIHVLPNGLSRILFFAFGPLSAASTVGFYFAVRPHAESIPLFVGTVFNIIAGAIMNMMAVVQNTQFMVLPRKIREASDEASKEVLTQILWGVNVVQSGLDVSWDVFVSTGTALLAVALARHPRFGMLFAVPGVAVGIGALAFNLYTFPTAPAAAGLIDLGPAVGAWYVIALVRLAFVSGWVSKNTCS
jgi:hypothetical protein